MKRRLLPILLCLLAARMARAATCSPTTFVTAATYPAPQPVQLAVADFNHDGFPDIAVATGSPLGVAVLLNAGDGTFGAPIVTPISYGPFQIGAADLRGNGNGDLIVMTFDGILVLLGNGDGTFAAPTHYTATGFGSIAMAIGKFDANDSPDIVVSDSSGSNVDLFPGNGDGTFGAPIASHAAGATALAVGDFNGDSKLDLVGANADSGTVSLLPGLGDGRFGAPTDFVGGGQLGPIAAVDLDGDGRLDAAVVSGNFVSVLLGDGNGSFQAALQYPAGFSPQALVTADFDQDGVPDVAVLDGGGQGVSVLFGGGDGSLAPPTQYLVSNTASALAVGDFDGDTRPDLVSNGPDAVVVLLNAGGGLLRAVPESSLPSGPYPTNTQIELAVGDWNGDGRQDLAWSDGVHVDVIESLGGGRFGQTQVLTGPPSTSALLGPAAADFDGDGHSDIVTAGYDNVYLFPGIGDGTFAAPIPVFPSGNVGTVAAADFNGDGKADFAFAPTCCAETIFVLLGNGDGTFQPALQTPTAGNVFFMLPADLDGDGKPDLLITSESTVDVMMNNGDGTFQPPATLTGQSNSCCYVFFVAVGRFSTGGPADVLVTQGNPYANFYVTLFPGNGDGTFGSPVQIALNSSSGAVAAGDYDGDGNDDFAVLSGNQNVQVFLGLGDRHFQSPVAYPAIPAVAMTTAEFAGAGGPDVAMIGSGGYGSAAIATLTNSRLGAAVRSASVLVGSPAALSATASGYGPLTYQWRKEGVPLVDGGTISGATTATLTIDPAGFDDAGSYDVLVTDSCTTTASNAATLSVEFADVPATNIFHDDIITIATAGVTAGCGGADYCPASIVTRAQMSVFLLKSEHGSAYVPPACTGVFTDVPCPGPFTDWIEQLAAEGVTAGCGGGNYCPDASITRSQMAVFLLKTSQGSSYVPPPAVGIFGDVPPGSFAADWIEDLYNRGIAGGCSASPLLYCPSNPVNRGQMAAFLVNTFF